MIFLPLIFLIAKAAELRDIRLVGQSVDQKIEKFPGPPIVMPVVPKIHTMSSKIAFYVLAGVVSMGLVVLVCALVIFILGQIEAVPPLHATRLGKTLRVKNFRASEIWSDDDQSTDCDSGFDWQGTGLASPPPGWLPRGVFK